MSLNDIVFSKKEPIHGFEDFSVNGIALSKESLSVIRQKFQLRVQEYQKVLDYISHKQYTEVLTPIDGDGREFWVQAITNPQDDLKVDIGDGLYLEMNVREAKEWIGKTIKETEMKIEGIDSLLSDGN